MISKLRPLIPIFLLLLIFVTISTEARQKKETSFTNNILSTIIFPLEHTLTYSAKKVENFWFSYLYLVDTKEQNHDLSELVMRQKQHINRLTEERQSNMRLKNLLNFRQEYKSLEMVGAQIVAWDPGPWFNSMVINAGASKNIGLNQAVVHDLGVVGRVAKVSPYYATILLITDYNSSIDALVQRSRVRGLVSGQGANPCQLKYVLRDSDIKVGDQVITSGLDGIFPVGVPLGTITKINAKSADKFLEIELSPTVNITSLEEVLVITKAPTIPKAWPNEELFGPWLPEETSTKSKSVIPDYKW